MVNRKAAVIASSVVAVLIAAAVVLSVVFLVVLPTDGSSSDSAPSDLPSDSPRPGVKMLESSGNVTKDNWAMTFDDDAPIAAIRAEMGERF